MQLRMLGTPLGPGRSRSSATSPSRRAGFVHGWNELVRCLAPDVSPTVEELRLAYRVPAEVMELALPLLR